MLTAFLDANVLYPVAIRNVLMELAQADAFAPLWTEAVHLEWMRNLAAIAPHLTVARIARTRALMEAYVGDVMVTGYEPLIDGLVLPDPDDRHVLAAAIHGGASVIVTSNLRDFPVAALAPYNITAEHPDAFVLRLLNDDPRPRSLSPGRRPRRPDQSAIERRPISGDPRTRRAGDHGCSVAPIC